MSQFEALQQDVKIIHEKINMLLEKAKVKWDDKAEKFVGIMRQSTSQSIADHMQAMRAGSSMDYHGDENNDEDGLGDDDDDNDDDDDGEEAPFGH